MIKFVPLFGATLLGLNGSALAQDTTIPTSPNPDFGNATLQSDSEVIESTGQETDVVVRRIVCGQHRVNRGRPSNPNKVVVRCRVPNGAQIHSVRGMARNSHNRSSGFCKSSTNGRYRECEIGWSAFLGTYHYSEGGRSIGWDFANWLDRSEPRYAWLEVYYTP